MKGLDRMRCNKYVTSIVVGLLAIALFATSAFAFSHTIEILPGTTAYSPEFYAQNGDPVNLQASAHSGVYGHNLHGKLQKYTGILWFWTDVGAFRMTHGDPAYGFGYTKGSLSSGTYRFEFWNGNALITDLVELSYTIKVDGNEI